MLAKLVYKEFNIDFRSSAADDCVIQHEIHDSTRCQKNLTGKGKGQGKTSKGTREEMGKEGEEGSLLHPTPPSPPEKDVTNSGAQSVTAESLAGDVGNDEPAASSHSKRKKARVVLLNLTENGQEDVVLFFERNDFIYNKRRTDHTFVSKTNKAWEDLAQEMGKEVKALITFLSASVPRLGNSEGRQVGRQLLR